MRAKPSRILLALVILLTGCTYKEIPAPTPVTVDCSLSTFAINVASMDSVSNCLLIDGSFTIGATGGASPYVFSLNGGSFQAVSTFSNLGPGTYLVTARDANQCPKSISVEVFAKGSQLASSVTIVNDSECLTDNGSITITPSGGKRPYTFQFGTMAQVSDSAFFNLKVGYYNITMRDSSGCIRVINAWVKRGDTGTSYSAVIAPILNANCATSGCHNGDLGASRNWTVYDNVKTNAANIKTRTENRSMPLTGSLTQDQIDLIACWVDDGAKNN